MEPDVLRAQLTFAVRAAVTRLGSHDAAALLQQLQGQSPHWAAITESDVASVLADLQSVGTAAADQTLKERSPEFRRERALADYRDARLARQAQDLAARSRAAETAQAEVHRRVAARREEQELLDGYRALDEVEHPRVGPWDRDDWLDDTVVIRAQARQRVTEAWTAAPGRPGSLPTEGWGLLGQPSAVLTGLSNLDQPLLFEVLDNPEWAVLRLGGAPSLVDHLMGTASRWAGRREYTIVRRSPHRLVASCPAHELSLPPSAKYSSWSYWPLAALVGYGCVGAFADMSRWPVPRPESMDFDWEPGLAVRAFKSSYRAARALSMVIGHPGRGAGTWQLQVWRHPPSAPEQHQPVSRATHSSARAVRGPEIGRCEVCHRPLYSEASVLVGHGPECARRFGLEPPAYDGKGRKVTTVSAASWLKIVDETVRSSSSM